MTNASTIEVFAALTTGRFTARYSHTTSKLFGLGRAKLSSTGGGYLDLSATFDVGGIGITPHVGRQTVKNFDANSYTDYSVTGTIRPAQRLPVDIGGRVREGPGGQAAALSSGGRGADQPAAARACRSRTPAARPSMPQRPPFDPLVALHRWLALACLLLGLWAPSLSQAAEEQVRDGIVHKAWLDDPRSSLPPQAALESAWASYEGLFSRGFTASTTWLRLRIDPAAAGPARLATDHRLVLLIQPAHLDEVAIFRADRPGQPPLLVGDKVERSDRAREFLQNAVVFDDVQAPFEVLVRLRTQSNHSIHVQALRRDAARDLSHRQESLLLAYGVFLVLVMAWAVLVWQAERGLLPGLFIAHQGVGLLVAVALMAAGRSEGLEGLAALVVERLGSIMRPLYLVLGMLFHARLLADLGAGRTESRVLQGGVALGVLALGLVALGEVRPGLLVTQATTAVFMVITVVVAFRLRRDPAERDGQGSGLRVYVVAVYVLMAVLTLPQSLRVLGLWKAGAWTFLGFIAYGVASAVLLGGLLVLRAKEARWRRRQAELAVAQAHREAEAQRARVTEQAELMTMLTHELKTPLSVVSLALGSAGQQPSMRARALRAVDNMRDVIDRCGDAARFDDQMGRHDAPPVLAPVAMADVLAEAAQAQVQAGRIDLPESVSVPPCLADRQLLLVIVGNLLDNALKYGHPDSRVKATVERSTFEGRPGVALRVTNRVGPAGRPDAAHLFEKYYRGPRARNRSGSGLGLYLSRRLAYRLGGELSLLEPAGDEVSFELWLPS